MLFLRLNACMCRNGKINVYSFRIEHMGSCEWINECAYNELDEWMIM